MNTSNQNYAHPNNQQYFDHLTRPNGAIPAPQSSMGQGNLVCASNFAYNSGCPKQQVPESGPGIQNLHERASQDDGKIVDEIEKTIQSLLNLNIFESFSNSDDNDSKNNVSEGAAENTTTTAGTNDVSNSEGKLSAESQSKELVSNHPKSGIQSGDSKNNAHSHGHSDCKNDQKLKEAREQEKKDFVEQCTKQIVQKIESENVQNMEQLGQILHQYILEFSQVYESKFVNQGSPSHTEESITKLSHDNKLLKRAVKILYNRLSQTKHQQANTDTIIEQNRNLQRLLQSKDQQIAQMQQQMAHMRQMMINIAQLQANDSRFDNFDNFFDQGGYGGGQGQGGNQGYRDGDVF